MEGALFFVGGVAFAVPLLIFAVRSVRKRRSVREGVFHVALSVALLLFVNPLGQLVTLMPIDELLRDRWSTQLRDGMSTEELRATLGAPCKQRPGVWEYTPLPFFSLAHAWHFKVFVSGDRVTGFRRGT